MRIVIKSLTLKNYKGVKDFTLAVNGSDAVVSGKNEGGKTSLFDGWLWLMFDMDSRGNKGADAAKTTKGAKFAHHLTHAVEAVIMADEREYTLRKELEEKWSKPRGKSQERFDGNENHFWVDGVPKQLKDFTAFVESLVPVELFKILSDPMFFSINLHWKQRLEMLVALAGGITNADVVAYDETLVTFLDKLGDKDLSDYRKMVQAQISTIKKEIDSIPNRIDELNYSLPVAQDYGIIEEKIAAATATRAELEAQRTNVAEALKPYLALSDDLFRAKRNRQTAIDALVSEKNSSGAELVNLYRSASKGYSNLAEERTNCELSLAGHKRKLESLTALNAELKEDYKAKDEIKRKIFAEAFADMTVSVATACITCGQQLPSEIIDGKMDVLRSNFEDDKARRLLRASDELNRIIKNGQDNKAQFTSLTEIVEKETVDLAELEAKKIAAYDVMNAAKESVDSFHYISEADVVSDLSILAFDNQIADLQAKIDEPHENNALELSQKISAVTAEISALQQILYGKEQEEKTLARIAELEQSMTDKGILLTSLEGDIDMSDAFVIAKTECLEKKISSYFTAVKFQMFKEQNNGGLEETCEAIVKETVFSKANTAGQINAGLDIIRTFSKFNDIYVPIFVDRVESINEVLAVPTQVITLLVNFEELAVKTV